MERSKKEEVEMKDNRLIPIQLGLDREFKNSFWNYDPEQVIKEASEEFSEQFGLGGFCIASRKKWNSCGSPSLKNFPESLIREIPNKISLKEIPDFLFTEFKKEVKVLPDSRLEELFDVIEVLEGEESDVYKRRFLAARLGTAQSASMLESLNQSLDNKGGIVVGFTGKLISVNDNLTTAGSSWSSGNYVILGINPYPVKVLLHEIGHVFGAEHSEQEKSIMFPESLRQKQKFTKEDRARIIKGIQRKALK